MNESNRCPQCDAPLPKAGAPCPRCLLSAGLEVSEDHQLGPGFLEDLSEGPKQPQQAGSSPSEQVVAFGGHAPPFVPLTERIGDRIDHYNGSSLFSASGFRLQDAHLQRFGLEFLSCFLVATILPV
jgi:hypothetical protein